jgi:hypothetical protein
MTANDMIALVGAIVAGAVTVIGALTTMFFVLRGQLNKVYHVVNGRYEAVVAENAELHRQLEAAHQKPRHK